MIRYFYNPSTGDILGSAEYTDVCLVNCVEDATDYIESQQRVSEHDYMIDLDTLTLISKSASN